MYVGNLIRNIKEKNITVESELVMENNNLKCWSHFDHVIQQILILSLIFCFFFFSIFLMKFLPASFKHIVPVWRWLLLDNYRFCKTGIRRSFWSCWQNIEKKKKQKIRLKMRILNCWHWFPLPELRQIYWDTLEKIFFYYRFCKTGIRRSFWSCWHVAITIFIKFIRR
jgi:hypothetical protein